MLVKGHKLPVINLGCSVQHDCYRQQYCVVYLGVVERVNCKYSYNTHTRTQMVIMWDNGGVANFIVVIIFQ